MEGEADVLDYRNATEALRQAADFKHPALLSHKQFMDTTEY
jgi:hypothetical protein